MQGFDNTATAFLKLVKIKPVEPYYTTVIVS